MAVRMTEDDKEFAKEIIERVKERGSVCFGAWQHGDCCCPLASLLDDEERKGSYIIEDVADIINRPVKWVSDFVDYIDMSWRKTFYNMKVIRHPASSAEATAAYVFSELSKAGLRLMANGSSVMRSFIVGGEKDE